MNVSKSVRKLQERCIHLPGEKVSFHIYFWGAHSNHLDNPLHKHSFFEFCYINSGTGLYFEDGQNYELKEGTFICSHPGKLHRIHEGKNLSIFWVGFEVNESSSKKEGISLFRQLAKINKKVIHNAESSETAQLWHVLMKHGENSYSPELLCSLGHSLLLSLQTLFCGFNEIEDLDKYDSSNNGLIDQAQLFIRDNLTMLLSLEDVAQYLNVSTRHLSRLFSNHLGLTFTAFLRRERIGASVEKLRDSDLSIKAISELYCFSSVHYFTRVFSEETSLTPGEYRKLTRG
ncbi:helix-turn-helix domain-containing protein [Halalkalibacter alkaliphilus]|uniref:Helix-turn-helix domain-containing protein n=1 Tax=Halalkalibacter alkaliphilus TaxID=2917993 RepID=A0A9X1ZXJ9_9BACI|nr:helix-turn-helix domain-containing protein [Halalkalibacter alkaliphilus]MCL7746211.1 helix-turn-helix domain-containing protein [Halalkalibacter alkaliphilus]